MQMVWLMCGLCFIADSHLDLKRKMNEVLKKFSENEKDKEMITLKLNYFEGEEGRLNEKAARFA